MRGRTIRKGAVRGSDIRNGTITAAGPRRRRRGRSSARPAPAPRAPPGPPPGRRAGKDGVNGKDGKDGKDGADGAPGLPGDATTPDAVATWTVHHGANGQTSITARSDDTIPAGAFFEPISVEVAGDLSSCPYLTGLFTPDGVYPNAVNFGRAGSSMTVEGTGLTSVNIGSPKKLMTQISCSDGGFGSLPLPTFDATFTFQWTVRDTTPTRAFN